MRTEDEPARDNTPASGDLDIGGSGSAVGGLGGGSQLAARDTAPSDSAAAALETDSMVPGNDPDDDSSYSSDMVGSTNSAGHTVGLRVGDTGSNAADLGSDEESGNT